MKPSNLAHVRNWTRWWWNYLHNRLHLSSIFC